MINDRSKLRETLLIPTNGSHVKTEKVLYINTHIFGSQEEVTFRKEKINTYIPIHQEFIIAEQVL